MASLPARYVRPSARGRRQAASFARTTTLPAAEIAPRKRPSPGPEMSVSRSDRPLFRCCSCCSSCSCSWWWWCCCHRRRHCIVVVGGDGSGITVVIVIVVVAVDIVVVVVGGGGDGVVGIVFIVVVGGGGDAGIVVVIVTDDAFVYFVLSLENNFLHALSCHHWATYVRFR